VAGAEGRGVVHAGSAAAGVGVVVTREAAVAVLWLPVVLLFFVVVIAVVGDLGWRLLLRLLDRLAWLSLRNVRLSL
jgi:hypothetical protein